MFKYLFVVLVLGALVHNYNAMYIEEPEHVEEIIEDVNLGDNQLIETEAAATGLELVPEPVQDEPEMKESKTENRKIEKLEQLSKVKKQEDVVETTTEERNIPQHSGYSSPHYSNRLNRIHSPSTFFPRIG